jgi:hypothetical protein
VTTSITLPRPAPSPGRIVVLGDALGCLGVLLSDPAASLSVSPGAPAPLAVVIGVDGTAATSRRELRAVVHGQVRALTRVCAQWPALRHLIVLVDAPRNIAEDEVLQLCDTAADMTHRWIEQDCGVYVIVTFVVVSGCDDQGLLARRVLCRAGQIPAADAHGSVHWKEIAQATIQRVNTDGYL